MTNTKIKEVALFPSSFFPGVNFGYSNLSIITLQKCSAKDGCFKNTIRVVYGLVKAEDLIDLANGDDRRFDIHSFLQRNIFNNIGHGLLINGNPKVTNLINKSVIRVGDIADCVTGFYSGNDKKYLRVIDKNIKNGAKYKIADKELICTDFIQQRDLLHGITGKKYFIPIVKGGGIKFYKPDIWFMDWSKDAGTEYKKCKKARFQNSDYYFRYGIGVPMVSSAQITAAIIENRLFDQSIVGIFPKEERLLYYLLAFFNSPTCNKLIRTINPSANNPANYIKKIPLLLPKSEGVWQEIDRITKDIIKDLKSGMKLDDIKYERLNNIFFNLYKF